MSKILAPVILLMVSAGLFFSYISPALETKAAFEEQEARIDTTLKNVTDLTDKSATLQATLNQIPDAQLERLNKLLPDGIDVVRLVVDLDSLAAKHEISISEFDVPKQTSRGTRSGRGGSSDAVGKSAMTLSLSGEYERFKQFLYEVESSLVLMDVMSLKVEKRAASKGKETEEGEDEKDELHYTLTLQLYWLQ